MASIATCEKESASEHVTRGEQGVVITTEIDRHLDEGDAGLASLQAIGPFEYGDGSVVCIAIVGSGYSVQGRSCEIRPPAAFNPHTADL